VTPADRLFLTARQLDVDVIEVITRCIRQSPEKEICGYLLGDSAGKQRFYRVANLSGEPRSFFVSRFDFERLERHAQRHRLEIQAFIHSHQTILELSPADVLSRGESYLLWIVVVLSKDGFLYKMHLPSSRPDRP
jgi:proteasome lid subunit RPN8/RPN11